MRRTLLCVLEAVEDGLCSLEALGVLVVMRCAPFRMLEAAEGELCLLEGAGGAGDDLHATLYARGCGGWALFAGRVGGVGGAGGDAMRRTLLEAVEDGLCLLGVGGGGGDTMRAILQLGAVEGGSVYWRGRR